MTTEIEKRYWAIASSYHELKAEAEKRVVRWKYSNGQLWSHLPEPNPPLTTEEVGDANKAKYWFGYDSMNRVVCIRRFDDFTAYKQNPKRPKELPQPFPARAPGGKDGRIGAMPGRGLPGHRGSRLPDTSPDRRGRREASVGFAAPRFAGAGQRAAEGRNTRGAVMGNNQA